MEHTPNHITLDANYPEFPYQIDAEEEIDPRPSFTFIDGSRIILQEFDYPIVELPSNKPYLTASCAQIACNKICDEGMGNEEAEKYIINLFQYGKSIN